jgi:hypothetical protein
VDAEFTNSLVGTLAWDMMREPEQRQLAGIRGYRAGVNIAGPRNQIVRDFLEHPERGDWLLQIDSDMTWSPDAVEQMLAVADPEETPIVGGLCFGATDGHLWPTLYELTEGDEGPYLVRRPLAESEIGSLVRVTATGGAFLMVHRRVFETIRDKGLGTAAWPWFQEAELSGGPLGEDLTFCLRAGMAGFPVHVATGVHIGHVKPTLLGPGRFVAQQRAYAELQAQREAATNG